MKIAVGSKNPVKIEATRLAFKAIWPEKELEVFGYPVDSGVPDQPIGDEQCIRGARSRARKVLIQSFPDFAVGIEGGLCQGGDEWFDRGWAVVIANNGKEGLGSTCSIVVPDKILTVVYQGKELGKAADDAFGTVNCKEREGYFGLMTRNVITRVQAYQDGVIAALVSFIRPEFFETSVV